MITYFASLVSSSMHRSGVVVPHVLRMNLLGVTNMDDSERTYASMESLLSEEMIVHLTISNRRSSSGLECMMFI